MIFIIFPANLLAQQKEEFETNHIRIDPEWIKSNIAGGFIWAYDVKTDPEGNVYTTGYFKKYLQSGDSAINPDCNKYGDCGDIYFLMKHDNNGKFQWTRYAIGNSRPCKLAIDNKGFVYVAGSVFSRKLLFTTKDNTLLKLEKPDDYNSGIFICKYSPEGSLVKTKFISEGKQEFANDFFIDKKENICIGGNYVYYTHNDRGSQKRSYLLMKLNKDWDLVWKKQGDTTGLSHISAVYMDDNKNILTSGAYTNSIDLKSKKLVSKDYNQLAFLAKYSEDGNLKWATDSIGQYRFGSGQTIVCDKKGNTYVGVSTSYAYMFFTKVDKNGKIKWSVTTKGRSSNSPQKLLIDKKDNIYMCGEGYGGVFGSTGTDTFAFISKGSIDFFLAKYNSNGKILWLKAGGDRGTDYCKAISIYKNDLFAFGWYGSSLQFKDSILKSHTGYNFWLAKFDLKKLEYIDKQAPLKIPKTEHLAEKPTINRQNCSCRQQIVEKNRGNISSISHFVPYEKFKEMSAYTLPGGEMEYKKLFYSNLTFNVGHDETFYQFSLISFAPLKLLSPNNNFTINLSPCIKDTNFYETPVALSYSHPIKRHIYNFDHKKFDRSAKSYLEAIRIMYGISTKELIKEAINSKLYTESDDYYEINEFLKSVNKKYGTRFKSWKTEETGIDIKIRKIINELERRKINLTKFLLNEFILTEKKPHEINGEEARNIEFLLNKWLGNFSVKNFDRSIYPVVRIIFPGKNAGFEINADILRRWDTIANKTATDSNGKYISAEILTENKELFYSNFDGLRAEIKEICLAPTEISGTGILINFTKAELIAHSAKVNRPYSLQLANYPLFITDSLPVKKKPYAAFNYDTLLSDFTGFLVRNAAIKIPFKNNIINANGSDIIFNNKLVSGKIEIELNLQKDSAPQNDIKIKSGNSVISTTTEELENQLGAMGLIITKIEKTTYYKNSFVIDIYGRQRTIKVKNKEIIHFHFKKLAKKQ